MALLEQIQPLLARLGIEAAPFGPDTVAVQAFPSFLEKLDPAEFVRELLERGEQELLDLHEEELLACLNWCHRSSICSRSGGLQAAEREIGDREAGDDRAEGQRPLDRRRTRMSPCVAR